MKHLIRALGFYRPDICRIVTVLALMLGSIGLNVLKPWPLALIVDCVLGQKAFPAWMPAFWTERSQGAQLGVLIGVRAEP